MGVVYEDLYDHGDYASGSPTPEARRRPLTRVAASAYVACCSCGWTGTCDYPLTDEGRELAIGEWESNHALPLLELAVPASVATLVEQAERAVRDLIDRRPRAARLLLERHARWLAAVSSDLGVDDTARRLDITARTSRGGGRGR